MCVVCKSGVGVGQSSQTYTSCGRPSVWEGGIRFYTVDHSSRSSGKRSVAKTKTTTRAAVRAASRAGRVRTRCLERVLVYTLVHDGLLTHYSFSRRENVRLPTLLMDVILSDSPPPFVVNARLHALKPLSGCTVVGALWTPRRRRRDRRVLVAVVCGNRRENARRPSRKCLPKRFSRSGVAVFHFSDREKHVLFHAIVETSFS